MKRSFAFLAFLPILFPVLLHADSAEANKKVARRIFREILTEGHFDRATELYSSDFVNHGRNRDISLERDQEAARGWLQAFPDLRVVPEVVLTEGDLVAVAWRAAGTNSGKGNGLPATGRKINSNGITVWRVDEGRVKEEWSEFSYATLMGQLGFTPGGETLATPPVFAGEREASRTRRSAMEHNRAAVRQLYERTLGRGDFESCVNLFTAGFRGHESAADTTAAELIETMRGLRRFAPDLEVNVTMTVAEGDLVAVIWTARGTNSGSAFGREATGKPVSLRGMSVMRLEKGKIAESWGELDTAQLDLSK